jgi:hypothetical protein
MKTLVALVGTKYRGPEMVALLASLPQGEPLTLVREPGNRFDPNAIQVWARGQHLGYVKGNQNRDLAKAMDDARIKTVGGAPGAFPWPVSLAIDGGKQPMVEIDELERKDPR